MADRTTPPSGTGDRPGIESVTLDKLDGTITRAMLVGVFAALVFVVLIVLGTARTLPPLPATIAACAAFLLAVVGFAVMANRRMVRSVGREHGWRTVPAEVHLVGTGKRQHVQIRFDDIVLRAADGYSNTNKLADRQQLDVAGRAPGPYLIRIPGERAIYVFRPIRG